MPCALWELAMCPRQDCFAEIAFLLGGVGFGACSFWPSWRVAACRRVALASSTVPPPPKGATKLCGSI
eukprot:711481-Amphidinium_carterae.1